MILGIYGAGGLGREILDLAHDINLKQDRWKEIVFIDDSKEMNTISGIRVSTFEQLKVNFDVLEIEIVIAVGEPEIRLLLKNKIELAGFKMATLIHPYAKIGAETVIEKGSVVTYGCFISCYVRIGQNVHIQPYASVGHDTVIDDNTVISSYVCLAGACRIGSETYIGMQVPVRERISIGSKSIVGMGSVVQRDIPDNVIALGNPARVMKNNENHRVFS